ncbi:hypothetical protein COY93_03875 [Candidatus Uhrbacteria bacterium CG_4_10_14_0_8_um_filter_58_22]|uniref:Uncharacterized protein n=1 Tax=Candidatus Uhrbacteria bacterium CG_4_10_14_0_8_um_filter_58_22 TaxID=1975029 RepID=A0A2M7QA97_9BACT|nr:MAG: hypothetical protein AUJ19_00570 [Parcubacteria group bacterium CG1_02_58_44]PIY62126.1 MAG: hypothetical protein COY93_03875 [Candidatus Uhrbacteria bacterium CG_4_10_14_0_8_um_filter_58_22]
MDDLEAVVRSGSEVFSRPLDGFFRRAAFRLLEFRSYQPISCRTVGCRNLTETGSQSGWFGFDSHLAASSGPCYIFAI